jgi:hypothetical protein
MMTWRWTRMALALALAVSACALPGKKQRYGKAAVEVPAVVRVRNQNYADINVYLVQTGMRRRLGTVPGLSTQRFTVPRDVPLEAADIRLLADPIGGSGTYLSPAVQVHPGQEMDLVIAASLHLSSLAVWNP